MGREFYILMITLNINRLNSAQFSSVQLLSCFWFFLTPWTTAHQASLSITNCRSLPKPMSIELVMPSNNLILSRPLLLLPSIFPSIRVFSNEPALCIRWPKYWSFSFISPSNEHPGLICFRMDWFDLLAVQGTLKSLLQHHRWKASILQHLAFFIVQLSHPYMTTGKTSIRWTFVDKVMSLLFNMLSVQFSSVQSLSHVRLFATPWTAAGQASLSITNSRSLLKLMSIESVMPSSYLILCHPLLLLTPIPPSIRVFSNESTLRMRWPKYWSFSFSISPICCLGWSQFSFQASFNFMAAIIFCSDFRASPPPKKIKSATVSPSICHEVMGPDAMILVFWMLSFKPIFSLSSFTFIKRLFSSSSLSAIRVVSSAYLRLLIFLPSILIPACASSSPAFLVMYSA